jgi:hypothetical protein
MPITWRLITRVRVEKPSSSTIIAVAFQATYSLIGFKLKLPKPTMWWHNCSNRVDSREMSNT